MHIRNFQHHQRQIPDIATTLVGKDKVCILFVCLGNICRSPAAEGVIKSLAEERGLDMRLEIDSAGLYGGHAGDLPDHRMRIHAIQRGYSLLHRSRKVKSTDFSNFDLIIAMDDSNYDNLKAMAPTIDDEKKVVRMINFVKAFPQYDCIPDPYYDGAEGFELVLNLLEDGCQNLLDILFPAD